MDYNLKSQKREEKGEKVRSKQIVPAIVYGANGKNISLSLDRDEFNKLYKQAGESSLIDLFVGEQKEGKVLIQAVQYDPVTDRVTHVDLRRIDMNKEIITDISLQLISEAPIIKEQGGTLVKNIDQVKVKCLPGALVSAITVDLSVIKSFTDVIKVKNLILPPGITIISPSGDDVIAKAIPALTEEEIKAMEAKGAADIAKIEVAGAKEEVVEGEEATGDGKKEEKKDEKKEDKKDEKK